MLSDHSLISMLACVVLTSLTRSISAVSADALKFPAAAPLEMKAVLSGLALLVDITWFENEG